MMNCNYGCIRNIGRVLSGFPTNRPSFLTLLFSINAKGTCLCTLDPQSFRLSPVCVWGNIFVWTLYFWDFRRIISYAYNALEFSWWGLGQNTKSAQWHLSYKMKNLPMKCVTMLYLIAYRIASCCKMDMYIWSQFRISKTLFSELFWDVWVILLEL